MENDLLSEKVSESCKLHFPPEAVESGCMDMKNLNGGMGRQQPECFRIPFQEVGDFAEFGTAPVC